jgi:hypothetical protein
MSIDLEAWDPNVRFWPRVNKGESCWEWTGARLPYGYGSLRIKDKHYTAHRVSYELAHGTIDPAAHLDHICRHPSCVRPDHLRPVTPKQNGENRSGWGSRDLPRGVSIKRGRYKAQVMHNRKQYWGGSFDTVEEAESAAIALRNRLYTHNNSDWVEVT